MWWAKYLSFVPAAIFFPTVLTLMFLNWKQRRLRRRLRGSRIAAVDQTTADQTVASATAQSSAPEPASKGYAAELTAALAVLKGEPEPGDVDRASCPQTAGSRMNVSGRAGRPPGLVPPGGEPTSHARMQWVAGLATRQTHKQRDWIEG